jgi:phosphotransferase system  glucose/maltose/N-acetylglucosamine-specific IIC component
MKPPAFDAGNQVRSSSGEAEDAVDAAEPAFADEVGALAGLASAVAESTVPALATSSPVGAGAGSGTAEGRGAAVSAVTTASCVAQPSCALAMAATNRPAERQAASTRGIVLSLGFMGMGTDEPLGYAW